VKIGARAHDFGRHTAERMAAIIQEAGFGCVQLAPAKAIEGIGHFDEITPEHVAQIKDAFARHNVEIAVLGCYIDPALPEEDKRLDNVRIFQDNLRHAAALGVKVVGTETTSVPIDAPHALREARFALLTDSLRRMVSVAEALHVTIGIEPVAEHTLNTPALTRRLLDELKSDALKIIFDPANLLLPHTIGQQDSIFKEMITLCGEDIAVMHIKNIAVEDGKKVWCNLARGVIDYTYIFDWLHREKPDMRLQCDEVRMDSYKEDLECLKKLAKMN